MLLLFIIFLMPSPQRGVGYTKGEKAALAIFCCFAFRSNVFHMYGVGKARRRGENPACVRAKPCFLTGNFFFIPNAAARRWEWEIPQVFFVTPIAAMRRWA